MIYTAVNTSTNIKYELISFKFDYTLLFLLSLFGVSLQPFSERRTTKRHGQKRYFICGHVQPFLSLQANYIIYENCLLGSQRKRKETIGTTMYNQT